MTDTNPARLRVNLKREIDESYSIVFGEHLFSAIADYVARQTSTNDTDGYAIITDSNVHTLHASALKSAVREHGLKTDIFSFPAGEQYKRMETCLDIMDTMTTKGYNRDSFILALGGGVVGDMAGCMAALFNRGIPYIQIPTTLLAQADAAVGGKTGVNTEYGKNLLGVFQQPRRVFVDVATLTTLSDTEFSNGLAETIKHSIVQDASFFNYLETNLDTILAREPTALLKLAQTNCRIKAAIVEYDPQEYSLRRVLNYGHTIGHALEKLTNYELSHGSCVSIGMMAEARIAQELGHFSDQELQRQQNLLQRAGLPIHIPPTVSNKSLIELTDRDKKAKAGKARYCLPHIIGKMCEYGLNYVTPVDPAIVDKAVTQTRAT